MKLHSIRTKLLAINLLLILVVSVGLTAAGYFISSNAMIRYAIKASTDITNQMASNLTRELKNFSDRQYQEVEYHKAANYLAEKGISEKNDLLLLRRLAFFLDYMNTLPFCNSNVILANDGTLYQATTFFESDQQFLPDTAYSFFTLADEPVAGRAHWFVGEEGKLYLWRTLVSPQSGFYAGGRHIVEIDSLRLFEACDVYSMESGQQIYLVDAEFGIATPTSEPTTTPNAILTALKQSGQRLQDIVTHLHFEFDGARYLIQAKPLYNTELFLFSVTPVQTLLTESEFLLYMFAVIGGVAIAFSVVCTTFSTSAMTKNLSLLVNSIRNFSLSEFQAIPSPSQQDEITYVIYEFNRMGTKITELMEDIYDAELRQKNEQLKALQFEYNSLQAKINPHFLYNTLETISSMAKIAGAPQVSDATCTLGELLRQSTRTTRRFISLQQEISHTACYLEIHKLNLGERLCITWSIPNELLQNSVPRLVLQPIIENSISHGFENHIGICKLSLQAIICDGDLILSVADNGCGMTEDILQEVLSEQLDENSTNEHIGIASVHKRIQILYGEKYGVSIKSIPGIQTVVALMLPAVAYEEDGSDAYRNYH